MILLKTILTRIRNDMRFKKIEGENLRKAIKLGSIDEVKEFVNIANKCAGEVRLSSGKSTVDGKSIMGILSLDLKNELLLDVKYKEDMSELIHELKPYVVS